MLRIWLCVVLCVLTLDSTTAAWVFHAYWLWAVAALTPLAMIVIICSFVGGRQHDGEAGWLLVDAMELTNPDRPVAVKQATIAKRFLNLGFLTIGAPGSGK